PRRYIALHKPRGYVTTMWDPQGRPTVRDLVASVGERLYPVGRLDTASEGLLIMTNDGEFAHRLQHPRYGVPKTYRVAVSGVMAPAAIEKLRRGIVLEDGLFRPRSVILEKADAGETQLLLTITEGRNRVIRRALAALGYSVRRLIRTAVGGIRLGRLPAGRYRDLTDEERESMRKYLKICLTIRGK
ncbi:MAG: pseudouridine synthase, partial [Syntrophales bacterium]|nr:pseudouridine synthase [Syntrophales bacterium]